MSIVSGQQAVASDFISISGGAGDSGRVPKLNASGVLDASFLGLNLSGAIVASMRRTAPSGWLLCDGSAVSRSTYATLFAVLCPSATFTVTIASPAVFTSIAHGLGAGDKLRLTTTGSLPTGLSTGTDYYVISAGLTADNFEVSTTRGGSAVNTSGSQSGVHTWQVFNSGAGDGSTTFNLPNMKGRTPYGWDTSDANFDTLDTPNTYVGEKTHQLTVAELAAHTHSAVTSGSHFSNINGGSIDMGTSGSTGGNGAHNNMPPYRVTNFLIKT